jgi:(2Fe-2S) ferredoxin
MKKPAHHIFVCGSYRAGGEPKGICHQKQSLGLIQYLQEELSDRGLCETLVSSTGCLKLCDHGPVLIVYPEGHWYGNVTQEAIDEILDGLEKGQPAEKYLIP